MFLETIKSTFKACHLREKQKLSAVEDASTELDLLKFFLRIAWEIKAIDNKKYTAVSVLLDEIGRMIGGWAKQIREKLANNA